MLLTCHYHVAYSPSSTHSLCINTNRNCNLSVIALRPLHLNLKLFTPYRFSSSITHAVPSRLQSEGAAVTNHVVGDSAFDSLLSFLELSCLLSSAGVAVIACWKKELLAAIGSRAALLGILMLVVGVLSGAWIRRRQWSRVCRETVKDGLEVNLLERIEKLEEDLRSSATVVRVLSRQLEKLGIRFRVTRKALKEPITETAALAQKNSEAARSLAMQSDILEKELGEIQQVLLAMQEQQRKQLDLILAIGKAGKLWESKRKTSEEHDTLEISNSAEDEVKREVHQT
ncbi:uncharacterized protein LOC133290801 [Gastrolobium bilobum]|uniref:uncharacterized protein LOC133290801 n=1 Tax=Gastrolobium bilobum TaxID=150636 RepID=UPI002AB1B338|nr:uncharacterized protein LOC133290801 [Gastrolobium bilobum]